MQILHLYLMIPDGGLCTFNKGLNGIGLSAASGNHANFARLNGLEGRPHRTWRTKIQETLLFCGEK
jgi:hypothetical protein